jgi:predicted lipase
MDIIYSRLWALSKLTYKKNAENILEEFDYKYHASSIYLMYPDVKNHVLQKVIILMMNNDLYVGFAGTDIFNGVHGSYDWINNFKLNQIANKYATGKGMIHNGFAKSLDLCLSQDNSLLDLVMSLIDEKTQTIYITGHSKGGSLAMLFGYILRYRLSVDEIDISSQIVSFAAPKVGDKEFIEDFKKYENENNTFTRFININDISSDFPSSLLGYQHTGRLVRLIPKQTRLPYIKNSVKLSHSLLKKYQLFFTDFYKTHFQVYNQLLDFDDLQTRTLVGHQSADKVI